jgi:hypothetical protein
MDETPYPTFFDGQDIHDVLRECSMPDLRTACQRCLSMTGVETRSDMYRLIVQAPPPIQAKIRGTVQGGEDRATPPSAFQRLTDIEEALCDNTFMRAPAKQVIDDAIVEFMDRTSNSAMAFGVCAVCARETKRTEITAHWFDDVPSPMRLHPTVPHPAHDIFNGMLLHPAGVINSEIANMCRECLRALSSDKTPSFALANGMWIGAIPHELSFLTLPERLLIAKYFPAAYIIKLYPKKKGARHWDKRQMYSGLKGNVSTYQLDQGQIASMIDGNILPQRANVLAATIGITFVGPKNLPEKSLPDIFRVRRTRVQRALEWLKENNPLFANITISASRLAELPEDDVPYELQATTRLSTDVDKLHAEQEGYVPSQETGEVDDNEGDFHILEVFFFCSTKQHIVISR